MIRSLIRVAGFTGRRMANYALHFHQRTGFTQVIPRTKMPAEADEIFLLKSGTNPL